MKFDQLNIHEKVLQGIRDAGFTECTPVQSLTLPDALRGKDIAGQAQTGTGKTAAFLISVFSRMLTLPAPGRGPSPRVLIIAPTRELVVQITAEARLIGGHTGFRIIPVFGGIDYVKQRTDISQGVDMLIGTPGRLIDYLKQKVYSLRKTQFLVIDEADRMFDMGFIRDLRFILRRMSPYSQRQSMLFSATLSYRVLEICYEYMNMPELFSVTPEQVTVEQIEQQLCHVGKSEKIGLLLGFLRAKPDGRYLIFCNTRAAAEYLDRLMNANGYMAASLTGDLDQRKRMKVLKRFSEGTLPILVATDVASRGIHIDGVTHVINFDLPQDAEDYVHRIGRTARAGASGRAISLACEQYVHSLPEIEKFIRQKIPVTPITDDMIVTDYRTMPARSRTKGAPYPRKKSASSHRRERPSEQGRTSREKPGREWPSRKGNAASGAAKTGQQRRRRRKPSQRRHDISP